ncbi:MAG: hypothetical protein C0483_19450 [Pirellula sp.]|nr:hypothetical protein [Pirellula sp.]
MFRSEHAEQRVGRFGLHLLKLRTHLFARAALLSFAAVTGEHLAHLLTELFTLGGQFFLLLVGNLQFGGDFRVVERAHAADLNVELFQPIELMRHQHRVHLFFQCLLRLFQLAAHRFKLGAPFVFR